MIRVLLMIRFDEIYFSVRNVWSKYILMNNGVFTLVMFEEQEIEVRQPPLNIQYTISYE